MKSIVLFSGGMDSTVVLAQAKAAGKEVLALSFHYGSRHSERELAAAARLAARYGVRHQSRRIELAPSTSSLMGGGGPMSGAATIVPRRNLILIAYAAHFAECCGAEEILIGCNATDSAVYPDCRAEFINTMDLAVLWSGDAPIRVVAPLLELTKAQIVTLGNELGVPWDLTYSCYRGNQPPCHDCGACEVRDAAFREAA